MHNARAFHLFCCTIIAMMLAVPFASASTTAPELIVNGGFECGASPGPGDVKLNIDSTAIEGWTVMNGSIDWVGEQWVSFDGTRSIDLEGEAAFGGVEQTISTQPGQVYIVQFDLAGNPDGEPLIKKMQVQAAGQITERWFNSEGRTRDNLGWRTQNWLFTATDYRTTIRFISVKDGPGHCGAMLDNVSVTPLNQPLGVRRREPFKDAAPPVSNARCVEGPLLIDKSIPVALSIMGEGDDKVIDISAVSFKLDEDWLQADISAQILSWPAGKWRMVLEVLDGSRNVVRRSDAVIKNAGIILGRPLIETHCVKINLGPYDKSFNTASFRLCIESVAGETGK